VAFCIRHLRLCSTTYNFEFSEVCHVHFILFLFFFFPFKNSKTAHLLCGWKEGNIKIVGSQTVAPRDSPERHSDLGQQSPLQS